MESFHSIGFVIFYVKKTKKLSLEIIPFLNASHT